MVMSARQLRILRKAVSTVSTMTVMVLSTVPMITVTVPMVV